jgi:myo-inositol-1(or 4)-monophosphatase
VLDFILAVAREAGELLREGFGQKHEITYKSRADLVTDRDISSERLILERITARFPDHQIISEESGIRERHAHWLWLVDPLDGTNNYAHTYPFFAISIAVLKDDSLEFGVVYDPIHNEWFTANRGGGAYLNDQPIHVSAIKDVRHAQISTGFPYARWSATPNNLREVETMVMACQSIRCMGAASLDLCYVASGRSDGHWEGELNSWDSAAGALIVQAAGGSVTNLANRMYSPWDPFVVATNGLIHEEVLRRLNNKVVSGK